MINYSFAIDYLPFQQTPFVVHEVKTWQFLQSNVKCPQLLPAKSHMARPLFCLCQWVLPNQLGSVKTSVGFEVNTRPFSLTTQ